ncbi:shikimate kinase [Microbulbifer thermotolerans]|uniref:Shikimate kinase n=1 Tax=Microbulbifer thermotolerans TaxID=252514 RepID=A0AB35HSL4_MICTH|nr:shikimate kinase [Microbulbifer thermotolerans]MCX2780301.1 shikimate kinase [Microbulbifer thermotolerans]MCX2795519.1 shikimate kinase [Microbulbifer thermotolerans]MCX2800232.1 shikimate kinase [Microbulbifer thermotolerans]MCX2805318.1 shikimate kinase [Microbulbifer thermotolerans]MCX2835689.1 shikimate kinase [Microbulbifer thermotolerans]
MEHSIFLVGPMGAGKSTIGKLLALQLGLPFADTDKVLEDRTGADIPWIFDVEGEAGFRRRESEVLEDLCRGPVQVIATGGGIVLAEQNRRQLKKHGLVVYLQASADQLLERTAKNSNRPLLRVADPRARIIELLEQRDPLYREVADLICDTDDCTPKQAALMVAERLVSD